MQIQMLAIFLLFLSGGFLFSGTVKSQSINWAESEGGPFGLETGRDVVADEYGNVYVAGNYRQFCQFNGQITGNSGDDDLFVTKYNADGNFLLLRVHGGTMTDRYLGVTVDSKNNPICTGYAKLGAIQEKNGSSGMHAWDGIIMKYDSGLNPVWTKQIDGTVYTQGEDVATDQFDNVFVAGAHKGKSYIGTDTITSYGDADLWLAKFNSGGAYKWSFTAGGTGADGAAHVAIAKNGNALFAGFYKYTLYILNDSAVSAGYEDIFIASVSSMGNLSWLKSYGGDSNEILTGITTDPSGNIYITGYFKDTMKLGTLQLVSTGHFDGFVARLDANGNPVWATRFGSPSAGEYPQELNVSDNYKLFVTGQYFADSTVIGPDTLQSGGNGNLFFAEIDTGGSIIQSEGFGSVSSIDVAYGLHVDPNGNVFVSGSFNASMNLGAVTLVSLGAEDIFVFRYSDSSMLAIANSDTGPFCRGSSFQADLVLTGSFDSANVFYAELSDSTGSFAAVTDTIATFPGIYGGTFTLTIPQTVSPGTAYRFRIRSSSPAMISAENGFDITIGAPIANSLVVSGDSTICSGDSILLTATAGFTSYSWSTGGTAFQEWIFLPGTFYVTATDSNGCQTTDSHIVSTCVKTGIPVETPGWKVYPNPAGESFFISGESGRAFSVGVFDGTARMLIRYGGNDGFGEIPCDHLPPGLYIVGIVTGNQQINRRLLIVR